MYPRDRHIYDLLPHNHLGCHVILVRASPIIYPILTPLPALTILSGLRDSIFAAICIKHKNSPVFVPQIRSRGLPVQDNEGRVLRAREWGFGWVSWEIVNGRWSR